MKIDYSSICFVVMPFGKKLVDGMEVDFDKIYTEVFFPAISVVVLPEGGNLIPKRTDQDFYSAMIDSDMFAYLQYSRIAFVDITSLNPNVFYELGIRHQSNQSGTAIFRQTNQPIPFDISHIKTFPYDFEPIGQAEESRKLITEVLSNSLEHNRIDSPVQVALLTQRSEANPNLESALLKATIAMRNDDFNVAIDEYKKAISLAPDNPILHLDLGLLLKGQDRWSEAVNSFTKAKNMSPQYGESWRELGIAQNKLFHKTQDLSLSDGKEALLQAISINNTDFDAYASLGGIYKREKDYKSALEMYSKSVDVSNGHPYPLLNAIVLQVREYGVVSISNKQKRQLLRAEVALKKQVSDNPPYNSPWCFFDLSTIKLLNNDTDALSTLQNMPNIATDWQYKTHFDTIFLLKDQAISINGFDDIMSHLEQYI